MQKNFEEPIQWVDISKQVVRKTENLQQKYVELNQLNWKTHNDLIRLQTDLEWMMQGYAKMEKSNLEQTFQDLKEQNVTTHIKFHMEKQSFIVQIQDGKG